MRRDAELWWIQAKRDYRTAQNCHRSRDYYASVFFCHQAVEKAMKAAIVQNLRELPPRSHNLTELCDALDMPRKFRAFFMELTPEYVITRYPDAAGGPIESLYDGHISRRILDRTKEVLSWVSKRLRK